MARRCLYILGLVLLGGLIVDYARQSSSHPADPAASDVPLVAADAATLDFGVVDVVEEFSWPVRLENATRELVILRDVRASCGCVAVEPSELVIPPAGAAELKLQLDLTPASAAASLKSKREFQVLLTGKVHGGPAVQDVEWVVKGIVRNQLTFEKPSINAIVSLDAIDGDEDPVIAEIAFSSTVNLQDADAELIQQIRNSSDQSSFDCKAILDSPRAGRIVLTPSGSITKGVHQLSTVLSARTSGDVVLPPVHIPTRVSCTGRFRVIPSNVVFGRVPVGARRTESIVIISRKDEEFQVRSLTATDQSVTAEWEPLERGQKPFGVQVHVTKKVKVAGPALATLRLQLVSESGYDEDVQVSVVSIGK